MKLINMLPAIASLAITWSVNAQVGQKLAEGSGSAIKQPISILMQLEPVLLNKAPEHSLSPKKEVFGFDISKTKQQFPGLISRQTTWTQKGKNNPVATSKEAINAEQLIPLLVAALQQQHEELIEIQKKLDKLQER